MALLADIVRARHLAHRRLPRTIDEAQHRMRMLGVTGWRRIPGIDPIRVRADDESLYQYDAGHGLTVDFDLAPPTRDCRLPVLSAPLLPGKPHVVWHGAGPRVVPEIAFDESVT